jgi:cell division protein FtsQ
MKNWKTILIHIIWSLAGAALIFLFVMAWKAKTEKRLSHVQVDLVGETTAALFMDENEINGILKEQGVKEGVPVGRINLTTVEHNLEKIQWIKNAELFINNQQFLQVNIEQRIPIARIFTVSGASFYIDGEGRRLPLKQLTVLRLPVFTGFPSDNDRLSKPDSLLLNDVLYFSKIILADSFFTAQIAQVQIEANGEFQFIPTLGDHTVLIGSIENLEDKLNRLYTFYKKVWVHSGINAYQVIDCRFDQQIVALKKGMQAIQYAPGAIPFAQLKPFFDSTLKVTNPTNNSAISSSTTNSKQVLLPANSKDTLTRKPLEVKAVSPKLDPSSASKMVAPGAKKVPAKKQAITKKIPLKLNNKQNNKSFNNKKKTAKAVMPQKTTSNNNNN